MTAQRPAVAMIGGTPLAHTNGMFSALAVNALNTVLGSVESPGGVFFTPEFAPAGTSAASTAINKVAESGIKLLLVDSVNPVFATPAAWKIREALQTIPYIVSFGNFIDETSVLSDLILPDHSFLESWVEGMPESGSKTAVVGFAPPVMAPLHDTRSTPDVLLDVGRRLKKPLNLPWQNFEAMLRTEIEKLPKADWTALQRQGGWFGEAPVSSSAGRSQTASAAKTPAFTEPQFDGDPGQYPFHFLPYPSHAFLDGSLAHLPLMQELPDPLSSAVWSSWVEINEQAAEKLGIHQGDIVEIASQHGTLQVPAFPSPGIAPDVLAMPVGQGHETYTRYASGRGENPIRILAPVVETDTGSLAWAATRVRITRIGNADGRLVLIGGSLREYPPERHHR
jgi:anaerobic selenocysteine-containing dehydrogenase